MAAITQATDAMALRGSPERPSEDSLAARKRRCFVEVAAAFGLPLPALAAVAVAALAGAFDLGGGPLEAGADLVGFDLGD